MTHPVHLFPVSVLTIDHVMVAHLREGSHSGRNAINALSEARQAEQDDPGRITLIHWSGVPGGDSRVQIALRSARLPDAGWQWDVDKAIQGAFLRAWSTCRLTLSLATLQRWTWLGAMSGNVCLFLPVEGDVDLQDNRMISRQIRTPDFGPDSDCMALISKTPKGFLPLFCAPVFTPFASRHEELGWTGGFAPHARYIVSQLVDDSRMIVS